jgi:hypothetical protein
MKMTKWNALNYLLVDMWPRLLHRVHTTSFSTRAPRRREPVPPTAVEDEAPSLLFLAAAAVAALGSSVRRGPPAVAGRLLTDEGAITMPPVCGPSVTDESNNRRENNMWSDNGFTFFLATW